jgi:NhaP-type Na+/H+ or K+/H+ antiporter
MVVAVALGSVAAVVLLALPWGAAVVLAAILAPTDPVLASEVQIRSEHDRDAVRLSLTAEGGLNDGAALPAVMLGLGLLGLHEIDGDDGPGWWWRDLLWPIGGGLAVGALLGLALGLLLRQRARRGDPLARDELIYVGAVSLGYGAALATHTSAFVVAFVAAVVMLLPMRADHFSGSEAPLAARLHAFGASLERLVEAGAVLAVGVALAGRRPDWLDLAFALCVVALVRPLSVWAVVRHGTMSPAQRRLVAWFGIRGLGSLYYLAFALSYGLPDGLAGPLVDATLLAVATSIVLHGLSATALMAAYQRRRGLPDNDRPPC